jgi:hypothetical protein
MLEFKRTEYKVDVYGEQIVFRKPTGLEKKKWLSDLGELAEKAKNGDAYDYDEDYKITKEFLALMDFPEKTFDSMEEAHQIDIINSVLDVKKS